MRGVVRSNTFIFYSNIDKTERVIWRRIREAREAATLSLPSLSDFSSNKEEQVMERITLGDFGRLNKLDKVAQGFQPANTFFFEIKNSVFTALKENQYSCKDDENCNVHLTDVLETCSTINPNGVFKSDKLLTLLGYSLKGRAKDWLNALPCGSITTWD
jgi:hypothetical protein